MLRIDVESYIDVTTALISMGFIAWNKIYMLCYCIVCYAFGRWQAKKPDWGQDSLKRKEGEEDEEGVEEEPAEEEEEEEEEEE